MMDFVLKDKGPFFFFLTEKKSNVNVLCTYNFQYHSLHGTERNVKM